MSRRLGLIAGVNHYQDPQFRPLQFAENDAKALAQWLVNAQGGKWSPADVQLVQGAYVTKELIESLIAQLCLQNAEPGDQILIYFAGHAFVDERNGEGYLALENTTYQNSASGLHLFSFVQHVLARSPAAQVVFILDCFQTGRAWSMQQSTPFDFKPLLGSAILNALPQQPGRLFFCSCRGNELAPEAGTNALGLFAHRMVLGLCGPAADPVTKTQTLQHLYNYLQGVLKDQQRPQIFGQGQQPFILVGQEPPPSTPPQQPASPASFASPSPFKSPTPFASPSPVQAPPSANAFMAQPDHSPVSTMTQTPSGIRYAQSGQLLNTTSEQQRMQQCQQLLNQAQQQAQAQLFPDALTSLEQALQIQPRYSAALTLKSQLLGTVGRTQEASATVEQLLQIEPQNALAWSMRAVLLNTMGHSQAAQEAIERSLELDANNPEAYAIKTRIMESMAAALNQSSQRQQNRYEQQETPKKRTGGLFLSILVQLVAFLLGVGGMGIGIVMPTLPAQLSLGLGSLGLALLSVWAARGAFRYGAVYLLPTLLFSLIGGGVIGALYKVGYNRVIGILQTRPDLFIPLVALVVWLAVAAVLPLVCAIVGLISGAIAKARARAS
ncbi:MAG TPA: tetratricopeptide repeat protein [Ktedonobacteraceae bacterium]|jgi:tetratricopeptide (TPR) repeat protein